MQAGLVGSLAAEEFAARVSVLSAIAAFTDLEGPDRRWRAYGATDADIRAGIARLEYLARAAQGLTDAMKAGRVAWA